MAIGDLEPVSLGGVSDVYYLDTGMFDAPAYSAVYVLDAERPAVVDTGIGTETDLVLDALDRLDIAPGELAYIVPTHVHLDHAGGAGYLAAACPDATVAVPEAGAPHLVDPGQLVAGTKRAVGDEWEFYAEPAAIPPDRVRSLADGDAVDLGDRELVAHDAPGHAPHQAVFHDAADGIVFTADAAGLYLPSPDEVRPLSPPPNFDLEQCLADVEAIASLDPAVLCYPHFGPARPADRLDTYARVLDDWVADVDAARGRFDDAEGVVDHFYERDHVLAELWGERRARANFDLNVRGAIHYLERRDG
ncbi:MAG: MBL fold metallo-hydrolase [Halobacteriales archaeon]